MGFPPHTFQGFALMNDVTTYQTLFVFDRCVRDEEEVVSRYSTKEARWIRIGKRRPWGAVEFTKAIPKNPEIKTIKILDW